MRKTYKGWKIGLHTSVSAAPYARLVAPDGKDWPQLWREGKDEIDMLNDVKRRIDTIIGFENRCLD
jgi:hypothetical protein